MRNQEIEEVIDVIPDGAKSEEFASRPVVDRPHTDTPRSQRSRGRVGLFKRFFGRGQDKTRAALDPKGASATVGSVAKQRRAPVKVEPKVFFANERTFLAWLHSSLLLAGASIAIVAFADANPWSQLYGVLLLPVAIAFICYAMYQYSRRAGMIRRQSPGPYYDTTGPTILGILLILSIVAQFAIKLYTVL